MMKILYLTDPGISAVCQVNLLGRFVGNHSRKHKPDLVVVAGDYIDVGDLLEQKMFKTLMLRDNMTHQQALERIAEDKRKPGITFFRPPSPPIPQPWYGENQMADLYNDMVCALEKNTDAPIVLNAGNHDLKTLDKVVQASTSGRVFHPAFTVEDINGLKVAGIPGSSEGIRFLDEPNYSWGESTMSDIQGIVRQMIFNIRPDLLLTHMPPRIFDSEQVIGYGSDRIPDWKLYARKSLLTTEGEHVGYDITRHIIEICTPSMVLCGHIEEARHVRDKKIHAGAIDRTGKTLVVNPGGFYPNWFESQPVGVLIGYEHNQVREVSFLVGNEVMHRVTEKSLYK